MRYLIIGDGYIGNYLYRYIEIYTSSSACLYKSKIYDYYSLKSLINHYPEHILINCAGKTGRPNVDACEEEKDIVFWANVELPVLIAEAMKERKSYWVHIGSGCIYDGYQKEWTEEDTPNFMGSFYSRTKRWSQDILKGFEEPLVLRIRMPVSGDNERCTIHKIIKYAKAGYPMMDLKNSLTFLPDMVKAVLFLTERGCSGEFNIVNKGALSPTDILDLYNISYRKLPYEEIRKTLKADRSNCILSIDKLLNTGFEMPDITERIKELKDET